MVILPQLNDIKLARDIGFKCGGGTTRFIWTSCVDCKKERWVRLLRGKPESDRCLKCGHINVRGSNSKIWRGGRKTIEGGYIKVWLSPDDFFYSMADKIHYVSEHRLVMAKSLGRCLSRWEIVHHINHNPSDNRLENLQLVGIDKHNQMTQMEIRIKELESIN